jgi:hypothetical protein
MKREVVLAVAVLASAFGASAKTPSPIPTPIGVGPLFHPGVSNLSAQRGLPVGSLRCSRVPGARVGVHLELFARGRVVIVPSGIGMALPLRRQGAYVLSSRCSYAVRTREPTGVIELAGATRVTLGDFFDVWGRQLTERRLVGFRASDGQHVRAYVDGRSRRGDPRAIVLRPHAQIVLEVGRYVRPHVTYQFRKGL